MQELVILDNKRNYIIQEKDYMPIQLMQEARYGCIDFLSNGFQLRRSAIK